MKYLVLSLLMFTGCATTKTPYAIEDLNVYDVVKVQRGEFAGCDAKVRSINTVFPNLHGSMSDIEFIYGEAECPDNRFEYSYEKIQAIKFEDLRVERPAPHEREFSRGRNR